MFSRYKSYRCMCGCHIHDFVFFMAILYSIGSFILLSAAIAFGIAPVALIPLVTLAFSVLVIWGNRFSIPCFYLPALVFEVVTAFLIFLGSFGVLAYGIYILCIFDENYTDVKRRKEPVVTVWMGIATLFFGLVCIAFSIIHAYFVELFLRDFLFIKDRNAVRDNTSLTTTEKYL
ncbi:hypothetical protein M3Y97_00960300 [Aphelenchoides bicaudatus]|nr:hypothetical protein M3Y97_00960300 [Aphelenchoides bicaudatus]